MKKNTFFSPAKSWKYAFKKPVTVAMKDIFDSPRVGPENSRGFHVNDWEKCIGCGTCSEICPTEAIRMVKRDELGEKEGEHAERPSIDYGRCCFCALCVDICTTGSLNMTKEYLLNSKNPDDYYLMPTETSIRQEGTGFGWQKDDASDLIDLERADMVLESVQRKDSFIEIVKGYSKEQALIESARCVGCEICTKTCPANMNIPDYIDAIWRSDMEDAVQQLYKTNPLPGVCGSICTHKCEGVCSIGQRGEPIAIRWLKRYIVDNAPDEVYEKVLMAQVSKEGSGSVAIVGGGPAGVSASYYLRTLGYDVDLYEARALVGGVARYGAPIYRLPDDRLDKDIDVLKMIGVKFHVNTKVGKDISLDELRDSHDAVFLGTGLPLSRSLNIPGADHDKIRFAMEFLEDMRDRGRNGTVEGVDIAPSCVVIGGGNVAFDVARSALRVQLLKYGKSDLSMVALESRDILPADLDEIEEGEEEGLKFNFGFGPEEIVVENGEIVGVKAKKCLSVFDEDRRFNPTFDENEKILVKGVQVIIAIGQMNDHPYFSDEMKEKLAMHLNRGKIKVTGTGQAEGFPWLFAGGDITKGPDIINGVADGHNAAKGIDEYLMSLKK